MSENFEGERDGVVRTSSPPLLRASSAVSEAERRKSDTLTPDLPTALTNLTNPTSPVNVGSGKAFYYSQLSIMLFERAVEENPSFPEDLDRVHSWFTKELSDAQKLVCLHELLSLISPSQHRFLFTSVAFDTHQSGEDETVWLDLAMSEAQKQSTRTTSGIEKNKVEERLKSLDLNPGESLFSGLTVAKGKLPAGGSDLSISTSASKASLSSTSDISNVSLGSTSDISSDIKKFAGNDITSDKFAQYPSQPHVPLKSLSPVSVGSESSKFSATFQKSAKASETVGKAPPGFLSPTATEFRPSEPSCYADTYMTDFGQWLRLLRLHKYSECLTPIYVEGREEMLRIDEKGLEAAGVAAMGARNKFLRLFERIRNELGQQ